MAETSQKTMTEKVSDQASDVAADAQENLADKARTEAENLRNAAAEETHKAANAADAAAHEFDPNSVQAQAMEQIASQIEEVAARVRGTDIDRLARTVRTTAERHPAMFLASAALAGFALTRFLSARDPRPARGFSDSYGGDPWSDDARWDSMRERTGGVTPDLASRGSV